MVPSRTISARALSIWKDLWDEQTLSVFVCCALALLFLAEIPFCMPVDSGYRRIACVAWLTVSVCTLGSAFLYSLGFIFESKFWSRPHAVWFLVAFIAPPLLLYSNLNGITLIGLDLEGVGQLNCARQLLDSDMAGGMFSTTYGTGYPDRQYMLANLFTMAFGPSLIALRLGNGMLFMVGYFFFLSSTRRFLISRDVPLSTLLSAFIGIVSVFGTYSVVNLRRFEQSGVPSGVLMFFFAGLLCFLMRPAASRLLWVTWSIGLFPFCYTPALAGWGLGLVMLGYLYYRRYYILFPALVYAVLSLTIAFLVCENSAAFEDKLRFNSQMHDNTWPQRCLEGLYRFWGPELSVVPVPLTLLVICCAFMAWKQREFGYYLILLWTFAVFLGVIACSGSGWNVLLTSSGRGMVAVPGLAFGVMMILAQHFYYNRNNLASLESLSIYFRAAILYVIFSATDAVLFTREDWFDLGLNNETIYDLSQMRYSKDPMPVVVYFVPPLNDDSVMYGLYFFPNLRIIEGPPPTGEHFPGYYVFSLNPQSSAKGSRIVITKE